MRLVLRCVVAFVATLAFWFGPKVLKEPYRDLADLLDIVVIGATLAACVYALMLPVQLCRAGSFTRRSWFVHPVAVSALGWLLVVSPGWVNIPLLSPLGDSVARAWPMAHFGFTAFFIVVAYSAALAVLIVRGAELLTSGVRGRMSRQDSKRRFNASGDKGPE